jgi:hypothetical protein
MSEITLMSVRAGAINDFLRQTTTLFMCVGTRVVDLPNDRATALYEEVKRTYPACEADVRAAMVDNDHDRLAYALRAQIRATDARVRRMDDERMNRNR